MRHDVQYHYAPLHKYPGMRPKDVAIWDQFLITHPDTFTHVWYDVHLGDPIANEKEREDALRSGMYDVARWCVDVVAADKNNFWAIEIKPNAGAGALGQALAYAALLNAERKSNPPIRPAVLTDTIAPITEQAALLLGVTMLTPHYNK